MYDVVFLRRVILEVLEKFHRLKGSIYDINSNLENG